MTRLHDMRCPAALLGDMIAERAALVIFDAGEEAEAGVRRLADYIVLHHAALFRLSCPLRSVVAPVDEAPAPAKQAAQDQGTQNAENRHVDAPSKLL